MKQLRFSTTKPMGMFGMMNPEEDHLPLVVPADCGKIYGGSKIGTAYIHGDAEQLAGFDIPTFFDGNMDQLDLPIEEQDILMMLPSGNYQCKAEVTDSYFKQYWITLK